MKMDLSTSWAGPLFFVERHWKKVAFRQTTAENWPSA